jgi:hypothetical protein
LVVFAHHPTRRIATNDHSGALFVFWKLRLKMNDSIKAKRVLLGLNAAVLLCVGLGWLLYFVFGQRSIEAIYVGPWIEVLHKGMMMEGRSILSLENYFRGAERLLWSATFAGALLVSSSILIVKSPANITRSVLCFIFVLFALTVSAIAFVYPLEIETRESTVWLHVLALRHGINIYDHSQVAFINQNHGPFDPFFKLSIAALFPFLDSWQVTRISVLLLPYAFLVVAWKWLSKQSSSLLDALYLSSMGYLFLIVSAKEFIFVGRSDATAALLLLPLVYLSFTVSPITLARAAAMGGIWGAIGISVILTNWRMLPVVSALFLFTLWMLRFKHLSQLRISAAYSGGCACSAAVIFALVLYYSFDFDLSLYYKHFFGTYTQASGHGHRTYGHASPIWFLGSLLNPTANLDNLKGGPVLWALAIYLLVHGKCSAQNLAWLFLGVVVFTACTVAYFFNYYGGGQWYYIPFVIILWFFLCANYRCLSPSRQAAVGVLAAVLLCVNAGTVVMPSLRRVASFSEAANFMGELRSLQAKHSIVSEDTFFFRTSYQGELIDMGDMISRIRGRGNYYGDEFNRTVDLHFQQVKNDPPDYIVTGFTASPELRRLAEQNYLRVASGPGNFTANGFGESQLLRRKDLTEARQHSGQTIFPADSVSTSARP